MQKVFILFLFIFSLPVLAGYPPANFKSPQETMNYFLKTMKGYKTGDAAAIKLAIKALDTSKLDPTTRVESAELAATKLIETLDRLEYIDIKSIPSAPTGETWIYKKQSVSLENVYHNVEIAIGLKGKKWLFSANTVSSISIFHESLKGVKIVSGVTALTNWKTKLKARMPAWSGSRIFILLNGQWLGIFLILLLSLLVEKTSRFIIGRYLTEVLVKKSIAFGKEKERHFTFPIGIMTFSGFWTLTVRFLELEDTHLSTFLRGGYIVFTVACVFAAYRVVDVISVWLLEKAEQTETKYDDILVPLISKTSKFVVFCLGIIFIGNSLTLDMKSIIAGMGIGGLAFAFAAKDTIANLFGSLTVLLDKPFLIGDLINIGGDIEGVVEQVGIRSTKVRTLYDSLITVPNGTLTSSHIDNWGKRNSRRWTTTLGLQYDTPSEKVEAFCEGLRELIRKNEYIKQENFRVYFNAFSASSLDILVYLFWKVPGWDDELLQKHKLSIQILDLAKEIGVDFAFPTQTLHVFNEDNTKSQ
jgi:MscS family membrane protein